MDRKPIVFGEPEYDEEIVASVARCIRSKWWGAGKLCSQVENALKRLTDASQCVLVGSGSAALHCSLIAADIGPGNEVITTPITYAATVNAIELVGAKPVFVDIDLETGNMDPDAVSAAIGPNTAAILPVHLAGRPCDMDNIIALARFNGVLVIEDAAHAIGAKIRGQSVGTFGLSSAFSFNYSKNLAAPEAGAVLTNSNEVAQIAKQFAYCGEESTAWERFNGLGSSSIVSGGTNYRPTDIAAAMLLPQLRRFDEVSLRRSLVWEAYDQGLAGLPIHKPASIQPDITHAKHLYQIRVPERDSFRNAMKGFGVFTGVHYKPLHLQPYYREKYGYKEGAFPHAEEFGRTTVSLPLSSRLSYTDIELVVEAVKKSL